MRDGGRGTDHLFLERRGEEGGEEGREKGVLPSDGQSGRRKAEETRRLMTHSLYHPCAARWGTSEQRGSGA